MLVGIDLGGSAIKAGCFSEAGERLAEGTVATPAAEGPKAGIREIAALLSRLKPWRQGPKPRRIGLGIPGVLDRDKGRLLRAPNLRSWERFPLRRDLERALGCWVRLENDANCAALGERWAGAARGEPNFLMVTLGTGVGGGLILGGRLWAGPGGMAGEFGHLCADPRGPRCGCGASGCIEAFASIGGVWRTAREAGLAFSAVEEVFRLARLGHPKARRAVELAGRALGRGMADVVQLLDVRVFVISGGMSASFGLLRPWIRAEMKERIYGRSPGKIRVVRSRLRNRAGIYGAAWLARGAT